MDLTVAACIWCSPRYGAVDAFRPVLHAGGLSAGAHIGADVAGLGDDRRLHPATGYGVILRSQWRSLRGAVCPDARESEERLGLDSFDALAAAQHRFHRSR